MQHSIDEHKRNRWLLFIYITRPIETGSYHSALLALKKCNPYLYGD